VEVIMSVRFSSLKPLGRMALASAALLAAVTVSGAAEWYVSPKGTAQGKGTRESPWDLESALLGKQSLRPGDTLYLLEGTYRRRPDEKFAVRLTGTDVKPIHVRPAPKEHAVIDGGLVVDNPSAYLWIWDLELLVSEPQPTKPVGPGSFPGDFTRPWGGLTMNGGKQCKYVNLVIHDCRQGISFWSGAQDSEVHGCLIYDNGWPATDRGHGHAIYTQNQDGTKAITDCIMTGGHGFTMHAYGSSRAYVDNYLVEGNIAYNANTFLIGGGRPSHNIRVLNNYLYGVPMQIGYSAPSNEDCEVRDNVIVNGDLSINKFNKVVKEGNEVLVKNAPRPKQGRAVLRPNKYDPQRANVALFNFEKKTALDVDVVDFLKKGDGFRLLDPRDFGKPVLAGTHGRATPGWPGRLAWTITRSQTCERTWNQPRKFRSWTGLRVPTARSDLSAGLASPRRRPQRHRQHTVWQAATVARSRVARPTGLADAVWPTR
jgi:hypothetical protein